MGKTYNSIVINAPVDKVWATLRDFQSTSWATGVIESHEALNDLRGDQLGAQRLLNGCFNETLLGLDDLKRTITYSINAAPGTPIENGVVGYVGNVHVHEVTSDGTSFVEWGSSWHGNDGPVAEFCDTIYQALLGSLHGHFS